MDGETLLLLQRLQIRIDFFLDGKKYAIKESIHVPSVGDEVRFKDVAYKVVYRIWIHDEKQPRVALSIEKVQDE